MPKKVFGLNLESEEKICGERRLKQFHNIKTTAGQSVAKASFEIKNRDFPLCYIVFGFQRFEIVVEHALDFASFKLY